MRTLSDCPSLSSLNGVRWCSSKLAPQTVSLRWHHSFRFALSATSLGTIAPCVPTRPLTAGWKGPLVVERNNFSFHPTVQCPRVTFVYRRTRRKLWICIPDVDSAGTSR